MNIEIPYTIFGYGYADDQSKVQTAKGTKYTYIAAIAAVLFIILFIILFTKKKD